MQTACDGVAGLDEMRKRRFDAVIVDGLMPGFSGIEFVGFRKITCPHTPVILHSGDINDGTDYAGEFDAAACIHKPYEVTMLLSVLRTVTQPVSTEQAAVPLV